LGIPAGDPLAIDATATAEGQEDLAEREEAGFARAQAAILAALQVEPGLRGLKDSLLIDATPEGLRVQLLDRDRLPMFPVGSDAMFPHTRRLLELVVQAIADTGNPVSVRGHTDSLPFAPGSGRDNWHLSADRANATRLAMVSAGLAAGRIVEVVGRADADPLVAGQPADPRNRRISVVLRRMAERGAAVGVPQRERGGG
jgi:chemotaxis protein MotB